MAKPGSTAKRLVVDYGELNKKTLNHSGSIPNMESTLEKIASCRYKTKMDKRSGFWQVDLTPNAQELLAFVTPQVRVLKWKVMPFGMACCGLFLGNSIVPLVSRKSPKTTNLFCAGSLDGAPIITQSRRHKPCSKIEVSYSAHSQLAFDASLLFTDCSAIATATCDLRAAALLLFEAITLPPR